MDTVRIAGDSGFTILAQSGLKISDHRKRVTNFHRATFRVVVGEGIISPRNIANELIIEHKLESHRTGLQQRRLRALGLHLTLYRQTTRDL